LVIKTQYEEWDMKIKILLGMICSLAVIAISGCGGGGGGAVATTVSGTAAKGPFAIGSAVKVFAIDTVTRAKGAQLGTGVVTDATGAYSVDIGAYTGPIMVEVTGSYKDEATGTTVALDPATPLRAAISNAAGSTSVMVTPLTELAVKEMGTVMSNTVIDAKNTEVGTVFKVANIISTKPADATVAGASGDINYGLVLASISQLVKNSQGKKLGEILDAMSTDINGPAMADRSTVGYKAAMFDFISNTAVNKTGVTPDTAGGINPSTVKIGVVKISTLGGTVGGIDFTVTLPAGISVAADATTKQTADGAVVLSGASATTGRSLSLATFDAAKLRVVMADSLGFPAGQFVTVACTVPATSTVTTTQLQDAVKAAIPTATGITGVAVTGVTLTATADIF
jgi:hypothetical protein